MRDAACEDFYQVFRSAQKQSRVLPKKIEQVVSKREDTLVF